MDITSLTTLYIIVMNIMLALTLIKLIYYVGKNTKDALIASFIFTLWITIELLFLGSNSILPSDISSISLFSIVLIGVVLAGLILFPIMKSLLSLPQHFLLLPQAFRMFFGAGFIIEAAYGIIPLDYGVVDGVLHITTAFLATTLAIYIAHGYRPKKSLVMVNLFGLLDIVIVAYGIAFFILGDIGVNHNVFYAVFFPAPIFIWLHLISLYKCYLHSKSTKSS